jgi:hypothetical protein
VVLPASMWAMIPMLRVLARGCWRVVASAMLAQFFVVLVRRSPPRVAAVGPHRCRGGREAAAYQR